MPEDGVLARALQRLGELPTLPTVVHQIVEITHRPEAGADDLVAVVAGDQSLTANLLRIANSPVFGVPYRVQTVRQAVVLLGFDEVRNVALSATVFRHLAAQQKPGDPRAREMFWKHCYLVAHLAREMYELFPDPSLRASYFTGGLLHDVGKVAAETLFPTEMNNAADTVREEGLSWRDAETRYIGVDHTILGGALLERWQLPPHLVEIARHHHTPWEGEISRPLATAVYYANEMALAVYGHSDEDAEAMAGRIVAAAEATPLPSLGLTASQPTLAEKLRLYHPQGPALAEVMAHAPKFG